MKRSPDRTKVALAVTHHTTSLTILSPTAVTCTGYGRAKFVFTFGAPNADATIDASSIGIWAAAGSNSSAVGAQTYAVIPGAFLAAATSGAISHNVHVLDVAIPAAKQFLIVSGSVNNSDVPLSATVELYQPLNAPPTTPSPAPVIVG